MRVRGYALQAIGAGAALLASAGTTIAPALAQVALGAYTCSAVANGMMTPMPGMDFLLRDDGTYRDAANQEGKYSFDNVTTRMGFSGGALNGSTADFKPSDEHNGLIQFYEGDKLSGVECQPKR